MFIINAFCNFFSYRCQFNHQNTKTLNRTFINEEIKKEILVNSSKSIGLSNFDQRMVKNSERTKYPALQKYYTFYITTQSSSSISEKDESNNESYNIYSSTSEVIITATSTIKSTAFVPIPKETLETTIIKDGTTVIDNKKRNEDLTTQLITEVDTLLVPITHVTSPREYKKIMQEKVFVNSTTTNQTSSVTKQKQTNMKAKVIDGVEVSVTSTETVFSQEHNQQSSLSTDKSDENIPIKQNQRTINHSHLLFGIGAATGVTATIILIIALIILTAQTYKGKKLESIIAVATKTNSANNETGMPTIAVFARSVFHTPLPGM